MNYLKHSHLLPSVLQSTLSELEEQGNCEQNTYERLEELKDLFLSYGFCLDYDLDGSILSIADIGGAIFEARAGN